MVKFTLNLLRREPGFPRLHETAKDDSAASQNSFCSPTPSEQSMRRIVSLSDGWNKQLPQDVWRLIVAQVADVPTLKTLRGVSKSMQRIIPTDSLAARPSAASVACVKDWVDTVPVPGQARPQMPERVAWTVERLTELDMQGWLDAVPFDPKFLARDAVAQMFAATPRLSAVKLRPDHITSDQIAELVAVLPPSVRSLTMGDRRKCDPELRLGHTMWGALSMHLGLTYLNISSTRLSGVDIRQFPLNLFNSLRQLVLTNNEITNTKGHLRLHDFKALELLDVSHNCINTAGARQLLLGGGCRTLEHLDLSNNEIHALETPGGGLAGLTGLKVLRLDENRFDERSLPSLPLRDLTELRQLSFVGCFRGDAIRRLPLTDTSIRELRLGTNLARWRMGDESRIDDDDLRYAPFLYMGRLETLILHGAKITPKGLFESPIFYTPSLRSVHFDAHYEPEMGRQFALEIYEYLKSFGSVAQRSNLREIRLGAFTVAISKERAACQSNDEMRELDLDEASN